MVEAVNKLNQRQFDDVGDPEIATRISQYEMAYRMQTSVPELKDLSARAQEGPRSLWGQDGRFRVRQ